MANPYYTPIDEQEGKSYQEVTDDGIDADNTVSDPDGDETEINETSSSSDDNGGGSGGGSANVPEGGKNVETSVGDSSQSSSGGGGGIFESDPADPGVGGDQQSLEEIKNEQSGDAFTSSGGSGNGGKNSADKSTATPDDSADDVIASAKSESIGDDLAQDTVQASQRTKGSTGGADGTESPNIIDDSGRETAAPGRGFPSDTSMDAPQSEKLKESLSGVQTKREAEAAREVFRDLESRTYTNLETDDVVIQFNDGRVSGRLSREAMAQERVEIRQESDVTYRAEEETPMPRQDLVEDDGSAGQETPRSSQDLDSTAAGGDGQTPAGIRQQLGNKLEQQTGATDLDAGEDFTVQKQGEKYVAQITDEGEETIQNQFAEQTSVTELSNPLAASGKVLTGEYGQNVQRRGQRNKRILYAELDQLIDQSAGMTPVDNSADEVRRRVDYNLYGADEAVGRAIRESGAGESIRKAKDNPIAYATAAAPVAAAEPTPAGEVVVAGLLAAGGIAAVSNSEIDVPKAPVGNIGEIDVPKGNVDETAEIEVPDRPQESSEEINAPTNQNNTGEIKLPDQTDGGEVSIPVIESQQLVEPDREDAESPEISREEINQPFGEPDQPGPSNRERQRRDDLNPYPREFPTGEEAVVGRDVTEPSVNAGVEGSELDNRPDETTDVGTGNRAGVGTGVDQRNDLGQRTPTDTTQRVDQGQGLDIGQILEPTVPQVQPVGLSVAQSTGYGTPTQTTTVTESIYPEATATTTTTTRTPKRPRDPDNEKEEEISWLDEEEDSLSEVWDTGVAQSLDEVFENTDDSGSGLTEKVDQALSGVFGR